MPKKVKTFTNEKMEGGKVDIYGFMMEIKKLNMVTCTQKHTRRLSKSY